MKSLTILFFSLFFVNLIFSQERVIKIVNEVSKKEIIIKENKRIRIKTVDGQKISGRFKIIGKETILIKKKKIELANIEKIKRNPLLISIITNGLFIYVGAGITIVGVAVGGITSQSSLFLLAIPGAGMIYSGIKSPNFLKGYKKDNKWKYQLITTSE
jgi:hypothetical protein